MRELESFFEKQINEHQLVVEKTRKLLMDYLESEEKLMPSTNDTGPAPMDIDALLVQAIKGRGKFGKGKGRGRGKG